MLEHTNVKAIPIYEPYQCRSHTDVGAKLMSEYSNVLAIQMSEHTNIYVGALPMSEPYHYNHWLFPLVFGQSKPHQPEGLLCIHIAIQTQWVPIQSKDGPALLKTN